jgi:hypothetical protein
MSGSCISWGVHLIGVFLMDVHLMGAGIQKTLLTVDLGYHTGANFG